MFAWNIVAWAAAFLAATGATIDKLIPLRHKQRLHHNMVKWWDWLDSKPVPDFLHLLSGWITLRFDALLRLHRLWAIVALAAFTWVFLSVAVIFSPYIPAIPASGEMTTISFRNDLRNFHVKPDNWIEACPLPHVGQVLTVFGFDLIVAAITFSTLRFLKDSSFRGSLLAITAHLAALFTLAILCLAANLFVSNLLLNHNVIGIRYARKQLEVEDITLFNYYSLTRGTNLFFGTYLPSGFTLSTNAVVEYYHVDQSLFRVAKNTTLYMSNLLHRRPVSISCFVTSRFRDGDRILTWSHLTEYYETPAILIYIGTLAIPALLVMLVLLLMVISKLVLSAVRKGFMYYFDLATEKNPKSDPKEFMPATLMGLALSSLIAICKGLGTLLASLHKGH
jgi:hypothetical protein